MIKSQHIVTLSEAEGYQAVLTILEEQSEDGLNKGVLKYFYNGNEIGVLQELEDKDYKFVDAVVAKANDKATAQGAYLWSY
jgi:hypothetical protein